MNIQSNNYHYQKTLFTFAALLVVSDYFIFSTSVAVASSIVDSPFGFLESFEVNVDSAYFTDVGANFVRDGKEAVWGKVETSPGNYNWSGVDQAVLSATTAGANVLLTVIPINFSDKQQCRLSGPCSIAKAECTPCDMERYKTFFTALINRYKGSVKYWQIGNEENNSWKESPAQYADFVKIHRDLLTASCIGCKLILGGVSSKPSGYYNFYRPVLTRAFEINATTGVRIFDIFDFHWAGWDGNYKQIKDISNSQYYDFKQYISDIKNDLNANNINAEIWITEMSTYSGDPVDTPVVNPSQTERQQAIELVKRYVYSLSAQIKKVFWVKMTEWYNFSQITNGFYDNTGIVNNPQADGDSSKKLAYYAYKKMVEKLQSADWNTIQTVQESGDVYVYKFSRPSGPVWVAWNDNAQTIHATISGLASNAILVSDAVPYSSSGSQVSNYATAFSTQTLMSSGGQATITLTSATPVFIEYSIDITPPSAPTWVTVI